MRFFEQVIKPRFQEKYDWVEVRAYANQTAEYLTKFIKSINAMKADYIFAADINSAPCVTARKEKPHKIFKNLDIDKTLIVIQEIEGWYLAGLDDLSCQKLGPPAFGTTNSLTKEQFDSLMPKKFTSRIDFIAEILKQFSASIATHKNQSFGYFIKKYQP
jgi:hypothetical protein